MLRKIGVTILVFFAAQTAQAGHHEVSEADGDQPLRLEALAEAFGWDMEGAQITTEKVADGLYVLFGIGGNIGVSIGDDGVLIVDDQFPQVMDKIEAAIAELGGNGVDYAVNTHWHFDHAEGNKRVGSQGNDAGFAPKSSRRYGNRGNSEPSHCQIRAATLPGTGVA